MILPIKIYIVVSPISIGTHIYFKTNKFTFGTFQVADSHAAHDEINDRDICSFVDCMPNKKI